MSTSEDIKNNGFIDISLAERMIQRYNGDKANLHVFIDNCNNAYNLLNPIYRIAFVSVVLSKIEGNIRSTLLNRTFNSWDALREHLLENYSEKRTFAQWQLELNSCKQGHNEPVLNYSNRVENCFIKLIKSLNPKLTKEAREANIDLLKSQALNIFISGLIPQLHILLKSQKPSNFEEAVSIAISEEQEIKSRQEMSSKHFEINKTKRCSNCHMLGHLSFQCRKQPMIRSVQTNRIPTCFNCNKKGHVSRDCWFNKPNSNNFNNFKQNTQFNNKPTRYQHNYNNQRPNSYNNKFRGTNNVNNASDTLNSKGPRMPVDPRTTN
ncbi:GATA zinc finger domain-containing protein 4-like [Galleria mellonella]|uniref:GATA zinc finger domain-containing protein 4-like n=1 Tax=Galleria mellonella TaxID=7137 RepID=A0A6J3C216_GALME|nr:GATA zinc finger domain-containing protein 4-like [Galleria mellonella]